jgi:hypothetical protein
MNVLELERNFIDPLTDQKGQRIVELKDNTYIKIINNIIIIIIIINIIISVIQTNPSLRT